MIKSRFPSGKNAHEKARLRPVAGHKRALWSPATLAPNSSILSHLRPGGVILPPPTPLPPAVVRAASEACM